MPELRRIKDSAAVRLDADFLAADEPEGMSGLDEDADTEAPPLKVEIAPLDELVRDTMGRFERYDTAMDAAMTIPLHQSLPLSRRVASDRKLWAWLGVVRYPSFVAWRWRPAAKREGPDQRSVMRFAGDPVRQTFARLWWAAELTRNADGDYGLTEKLLGLERFQDGYEAMFGRAFCQYRPALEAFIDVVGPESQETIREVSKEFGYVTTTLVLESMSADDVRGLLGEIVDAVTQRAA